MKNEPESLDELQSQYEEARQMLDDLHRRMAGPKRSADALKAMRRAEHELQAKVDTLFQKIRLETGKVAYKNRFNDLKAKESVE